MPKNILALLHSAYLHALTNAALSAIVLKNGVPFVYLYQIVGITLVCRGHTKPEEYYA